MSADLLNALMFAAERHRHQRRKDVAASPYINHPLALAQLLATTGGINDVTVLQAAILHDTIEDTETTAAELRMRFGDAVTDIVLEVTDDKSLPKQRRKELQIEHAPHKSTGASLVKLADKTCNLRDLASTPPSDWSLSRKQAYFDWAKQVVDSLPRVNEALFSAFDDAYSQRPKPNFPKMQKNDAAWLSMPGHLRGISGFVRTLATGDIEVELYDHSDEAQLAFDGDVSTIYTIEKADLPALADRLAFGFGGPVGDLSALPEKLSQFLDVQSLIEWLTQNSGIAVGKRVDLEV